MFFTPPKPSFIVDKTLNVFAMLYIKAFFKHNIEKQYGKHISSVNENIVDAENCRLIEIIHSTCVKVWKNTVFPL